MYIYVQACCLSLESTCLKEVTSPLGPPDQRSEMTNHLGNAYDSPHLSSYGARNLYFSYKILRGQVDKTRLVSDPWFRSRAHNAPAHMHT